MENWEKILLKKAGQEVSEEEIPVQQEEVETSEGQDPEIESGQDEGEPEAVEAATEDPTKQAPEEQEEATTSEEEVEVADWDEAPEQQPDAIDENKIFTTKLKEKLGDLFNETDPDEFFNTVKDKLSKQEEDALLNVPEDLKKAIELSKEGVNYKEYLKVSNVDYDGFSDTDLYANSIANFFKDPNGQIDEAKLQEHVDSLSDIQLQLEGSKIRTSLKQQQTMLQQQLVHEAATKKAEKERSVSSAVAELNSVMNFKVNPYQKEKIKSKLLNSDLSMFTSNGKVNYKEAAESLFKIENFDKIVNYLKTSTANTVKKQILEPLVNAEVRSNATPAMHQETLNPYLKAQKELMQQVRGW